MGRLYRTYREVVYDRDMLWQRFEELYTDDYVKDSRGIVEYLLGGEKEKRLLNIRLFDTTTRRKAYTKQTTEAKEKGHSNCPLCAIGSDANRTRIWTFEEMDADHVEAWSKGGATDIANCQMLCKTHNRAKGNR